MGVTRAPAVRMKRALAAVVGVWLAAAQPVRAEDIVIAQYGISLGSVPFAIALDNDMFKKAGVDITGAVSGGGGGTVLRNMLASTIPYGETAVAAVLAAQREGLDVVIVNTAYRSNGEASLLTKPNSDIKSVDDLAGKRVAITAPRSLSETTLLMVLKAKGVDPAKVTRVAAGGYGQGLTMLDQGAVVAAPLVTPLSIMKKAQYRTLYVNNEVLPPYVSNVGVTTRAFAKSNPEMLRKIIATRREAVKMFNANPKAFVPSLAKTFNITPEVMGEALDEAIKFEQIPEGRIVRVELERIAEGLMLVGEIKEPVNWDALIDESFLPDDLKTKK